MFINSRNSARAGFLFMTLTFALALLPAGCGSGSIPDFEIQTEEDVVELQAVNNAKAFVDVTLVPNGFDGVVQIGVDSHSTDDLPKGVGVLGICLSSESPTPDCDVTLDSTLDSVTPDLQGRLGFYVASDATLQPGTEVTVQIDGAVAGTGAHPVTTTFTLRIIAPLP